MITNDGMKGMAAFMGQDMAAPTAKPVAKAKDGQFDRALEEKATDKRPAADKVGTTVRPDYKAKLEEALKSLLGPKQNDPATLAKSPLAPVLTAPQPKGGQTIDLDKLPSETGAKLEKLQKAAEDFEANFVKDWFSKMRQVSMDSDKSATGAMAKDFLDQALAESVSRGTANLGIGSTVFAEQGKRVVQEALANLYAKTDTTA